MSHRSSPKQKQTQSPTVFVSSLCLFFCVSSASVVKSFFVASHSNCFRKAASCSCIPAISSRSSATSLSRMVRRSWLSKDSP